MRTSGGFSETRVKGADHHAERLASGITVTMTTPVGYWPGTCRNSLAVTDALISSERPDPHRAAVSETGLQVLLGELADAGLGNLYVNR
jgi:hypothetical protein